MWMFLGLIVLIIIGVTQYFYITSLINRCGKLKRYLDFHIESALTEGNTILRLNEEAALRNYWLDYVLRTFCLDLQNPYVNRPTFEEPRCYHCHYPNFAGHDTTCPWVILRPLTEVLYPTPPIVTTASIGSDSNIVLPLEPDEPDQSTDDDIMP